MTTTPSPSSTASYLSPDGRSYMEERSHPNSPESDPDGISLAVVGSFSENLSVLEEEEPESDQKEPSQSRRRQSVEVEFPLRITGGFEGLCPTNKV